MHLHELARRWGYCFPVFFSSLLLLVLFSSPARAEAEQNKVSFDAEAILPDNQVSDASYYDLNVQPGAKQELAIQLRNTSEKQIEVKVEANNAVTNQNGVLDYSKHGEKLLGSPSFEEIVSQPQTVMLAPSEEKQVIFQLTIPEKGFDGTVLGGFYCYENEKGQNKKTSGFALTNKFAYTIGAKLTCNDKKIEPSFSLTNVHPGLANGYLTVFATLENPQPILMSQLKMEAEVTKKRQSESLHKVSKTISIAPRSKFKLPINWEDEPLKKGTYELTIQLTDTSGKKWQLKKEFKIAGNDEKLNKEAVKVKKETKTSNALIYLLIGMFLLIILGLIWYISRLRKERN